MFRLALLLAGVAACHATAEPKPQSEEPSTRLFGFPWVTPTIVFGNGGATVTSTTTVQVPLYIVRTTTVWQQGAVSTVWVPAQTLPPSTLYKTSYVVSTVTQWAGAGTSTVYITSYFPVTVTVGAAQQVVAVETVTQYVAPSEFGVTRTVIRECSDTNTITRTFTRTRTRTRDATHQTGYLSRAQGGTSTLYPQTIPPQYLKF